MKITINVLYLQHFCTYYKLLYFCPTTVQLIISIKVCLKSMTFMNLLSFVLDYIDK